MSEPTPGSVRDRLTRGDLVDLRPEPGVSTPAATVPDWEPAKDIEADLLAELVTRPATHEVWTSRPIWLAGARIVGQLNLDGATLTRPMDLEDCRFEQPIILRDVDGVSLGLSGCQVPVLNGYNLRLRGSLRLDAGFTATDGIALVSARIGGQLECQGGTFTGVDGTFAGLDGTAIFADDLTVDGGVFCSEGFTANGAVRLSGAHIGGQLACGGGTFNNPGGDALFADGLTVDDSVVCNEGYAANGVVRLPGARIASQLICDGGTFNNPGGDALIANNLTVGGGMFCHNGFTANGAIRLHGAQIGIQLDCSGGTFNNPGETALAADLVRVDGDIVCGQGFSASGSVSLTSARIGGSLICTGSFDDPQGFALDLERAEVAKAIYFRPSLLAGHVDLSYARTGTWYDSRHTWPEKNTHTLLGFDYDAIAADPPVGIRQRLAWLRRDAAGFSPQLYEQLATVLRREGNVRDARIVQISAQWRRRFTINNWLDRVLLPTRLVWSIVLWATIGYGYRPWRILWPIVSLYIYGWWWFDRAEQRGDIIRAGGVDSNFDFSAGRYTADLLIPGASLGERDRFIPLDHIAWWTSLYTVAGWALAAMLIAGLTGVFKRQ